MKRETTSRNSETTEIEEEKGKLLLIVTKRQHTRTETSDRYKNMKCTV